MKVGIVTERFPPNVKGGGEISVSLLAQALKRRGIDVEVLSFDGCGEDVHEGIRVRRTRGSQSFHFPVEKSNIFEYPKIREFCRGKDLIHGYNMKYYPATAHVSKALGLSSVLTMTTYGFYYPQHVKGLKSPVTLLGGLHQRVSDALCRRLIIAGADVLVTLSAAQKRIYQELGFPGEKIRVIPNFVDPSFLERKPATFNTRARIILYVGRLSSEKGVGTLIRAFALVKPEDKDLKLVIVGTGPAADELQTLAAELGVDERVRFSGKLHYAETKKTYEKASVFVHPGLWPEPFGRTMLEAMASGIPVIATKTGSAPELLAGCGLLFEPGDVEQLASQIGLVLEDSELARNLSRDARARAESEYGEEKVLNKMVDLYREIAPKTGLVRVRTGPEDKPTVLAEGRLRELRHVFGRLIDRTAVPVLQKVFDVYFRLFSKPQDLSKLQAPRILFAMLTRGIGDAILCTPALNELRRRFPDSHITVLAIPYVSGLVSRFGSVDKVISLNIEHAGTSDIYKVVRKLRILKPDLAIDILHDRSVLSPLILFLSGARDLVGFSVGLRSIFFSHRYSMRTTGVHFADVVRNLVNGSGLGTGGRVDFETELANEADREFARSLLAGSSRPVICVHPGSKGIRERRWPEDRWCIVLDALLVKYGCGIIIIGSKNEKKLCRAIQDGMKGEAVNLAGMCSLGQLAAVIAQSDMLLSSCSGPLHMAVAMGVPAVYIGGGVDLTKWGAYGSSKLHRVVFRDHSCRLEKCVVCRDRWEKCTNSITSEAFLEVVSETIDSLDFKG